MQEVTEGSAAILCGLRSGCRFLSSVAAVDDEKYMTSSLLQYSHKHKNRHQFFSNAVTSRLDIVISVERK